MRTTAPRVATAVAAAFLLTLGTGAAASANPGDHPARQHHPGPHGHGPGSGAGGPRVIATGLDNPRGLTVAKDGSVYVAEAGVGGSGPCFTSPEGGGDTCYGETGAITRIAHGRQSQVVTGLPSLASTDQSAAIGVSDVVVDDGRLVFTVGLGNDPGLVGELPSLAATTSASLLRQTRGGWDRVADLGAYEAAVNPDGSATPDTNPHSVITTRHGYVAVDAGGNSLLRIDRRGNVSTLATFPTTLVTPPEGMGLPDPFPMDAVPTSVAQGPDGAFYVGQLTGFPFPVGGASVFRVVPGHEPTVYATGFTNIMDLAFGPDGRLYVLELAAKGIADPSGDITGALKRIGRGGTVTTVVTPPLQAPGGLAFDKRAVYISNGSIFPGGGQVLRVPLT
jgi:hypothetical protein